MNIAIPTVAAVSAALVLAPAAHADPDHYWAYMNCLKQVGVVFDNPNDAISLGFKVDRETLTTAPGVIYRELEDQAGMSLAQATSVVSCARANGRFLWGGP